MLVKRSLENESDVTLLTSQLMRTEGTGCMKSVSTMRKRDLGPISSCLFWAHVAAWAERVSWRSRIHIKSRFTSEPQRHIRAHRAAHGTLPILAVSLLLVSPVVIAVHVAAVQVHPRLLLVYNIFSLHAGKCQGVKAHRTLGPRRIDLLPQRLQVLDGGSARKPFCSAPQQRCSTQVDQRAILQLVCLIFNLVMDRGRERCHLALFEE